MGDGKVALCDSIAVMPPSQLPAVLDVEKPAYLIEPTRRVMMSPDGVHGVSLLSIMEPERHRCSAQGQGIACRAAEKRIPSTFSTRL